MPSEPRTIENMSSRYSPPGEPVTGVRECLGCGALVLAWGLHDEFHDRLDAEEAMTDKRLRSIAAVVGP